MQGCPLATANAICTHVGSQIITNVNSPGITLKTKEQLGGIMCGVIQTIRGFGGKVCSSDGPPAI